jgi:hypothetical protein
MGFTGSIPVVGSTKHGVIKERLKAQGARCRGD